MPSAAEFITFNYIYHEMIYKQNLQERQLGAHERKTSLSTSKKANQSSSRPAKPLLAASPQRLFPA